MLSFEEEINHHTHPTFWVRRDGKIIEEAFWLTDEDQDETMRSAGFFPLEEKYPGEEIAGYKEMGETFYVEK